MIGILLGYLFFHQGEKVEPVEKALEEAHESTTWTCAMHPQIRQPGPGQCPICGMDLIPVSESGGEENPQAVKMSETATKLANIETMTVGLESAAKSIRLNGKVVPNERLMKTQASHVSGRIEQLFVNTTGEQVRQGQKLALIYSPELITAQQELLQALSIKETQPALYRAAREKLKSLRISEGQINAIEESGEVQENIAIYADRSGIVMDKMVNVGDYLKTGEPLFTIADLSQVWVVFDAYESDLPFLETGEKISFSVASLPGKDFSGEITFIDPVVDPKTRVADVRVETRNPNGSLKPQMFATATVKAKLGDSDQLVVPKSAIMWTGERSVVYVKVPGAEEPTFNLREVVLGPALGNAYVILSGIEAGEQVVVNGTFTVDAAAQLAGKPSMMNPDMAMAGGETDERVEIAGETRSEIHQVLQSYFVLKDALVASERDKAATAARTMEKDLAAVDRKNMTGKAHERWMDILPKLKASLKEINTKANIDSQRKMFVQLSQGVVEIARSFGPFDEPVYVLFCPMANNNEGAAWLSASDKVLNPYYGDMMLNCGKVTEQIQ